jgi:hypothetical protein
VLITDMKMAEPLQPTPQEKKIDKLANVGAGPVGRPKKTGRHELKD